MAQSGGVVSNAGLRPVADPEGATAALALHVVMRGPENHRAHRIIAAAIPRQASVAASAATRGGPNVSDASTPPT